MNIQELDLGLELTENSKTGWAFSVSRKGSCIGATALCRRLCYGNGVRYQSRGQTEKRLRNFRTIQYLLDTSGVAALAQALGLLVDSARPRDYVLSKLSGRPMRVPFTLRIHDVGDFHRSDYVMAWQICASQRSDCSFWFYTRSFVHAEVFRELTRLADLPNVQGYLSVDVENYKAALAAMETTLPNSLWRLAVLQHHKEMPSEMMEAISQAGRQTINFPYHRSGHHVLPAAGLRSCPQVLGELPLANSRHSPSPCQQCRICLPLEVKA